MSNRYSRRSFVKRSAAITGVAAIGTWAAPFVMAESAAAAKLRVAVVGAGGMGGYSVDQALNEQLVAVVDVADGTVAEVMKKAEAKGQKPKAFFDYRKMLDDCHKDLDVVLVATPDHTHAPAAMRAIHLGKATFSQKPLAHNIAECYALAKAAQEKKVLTQMGNQGHCSEGIRRVCEYIWAGGVGNVTETHTILGRNFGGKGGRPQSKPVPAGLHWDEWIGPAPYRDYHDNLHPFNWRSWRQFGTGTIGDMACHNLDALFWALKVKEAKQFTIECLAQTAGSDEMYPTDNVVRWEIPARAGMPAVKIHAYDHGGIKPAIMLDTEKKYGRQFGEFTLFVGEKGMIGTDARIIPEERQKAVPPPPKTLPRANGGGPVEDLYHAIRHGTVPCSNFTDSAGPLTAFALSAHLAMFAGVGKKLVWDVEKMEVINQPEINQYVRREYRKGWEL